MPFVVFEGGEGVGKSTQMSLLAKSLGKTGVPVLSTREPGGTPLAECLRQIFKDEVSERDHPTPWTELLIVAAARAQHLDKVIRPQKKAGAWILCDRFLDSAFVYQGVRGQLGAESVHQIHRPFMNASDLPDLTFILDLPVAEASKRLQSRPLTQEQAVSPQSPGMNSRDRLDQMSLSLHETVCQGFRDLITNKTPYPSGHIPERILVDASQDPHSVAAQIESSLRERGLWPRGS